MWKKEKPDSKHSSLENGEVEDAQDGVSALVDSPQGVNAFVGKGVEFKGVISYNGTVRIDGRMEGEIHTEGTLLIGEEAVINATVSAGTIICKGKITGDIQAKEKIKLKAPAVLSGSVVTPTLSMEEGVLFNGNCEMNKSGVREHREKLIHSTMSQAGSLKRSAG